VALLAPVLTGQRLPHLRVVATGYAVGVLIFEVTELRLIGWQRLQGVVGVLGVLMLGLVFANGPPGVAIAPNGRAGLEGCKPSARHRAPVCRPPAP
jgi:hypothetical protein